MSDRMCACFECMANMPEPTDEEIIKSLQANIDEKDKDLEALRLKITDIASGMDTKAINNPNGVKASTLEAFATELYSVIDSNQTKLLTNDKE